MATATLYSQALLEMGQGAFNLPSDNYRAILVTNSYAPVVNTDAAFSTLSAYEASTSGTVGGYTEGGISLTGQAYSTTSGTATFSAYSVLWSALTSAALYRYLVIVRCAAGSGGSLTGTDKLLCYYDLTGTSTNLAGGGGAFQFNFNGSTTSVAGSVFTVTHTP